VKFWELAALVVVSSTSIGAAPIILEGPGTPIFSGWPPENYQRELRFQMVLASFERVQELCKEEASTPLPKGKSYLGCQRGYEVIVFQPKQGNELVFARIVAHEAAHRAGWPGDHPLPKD
jgi:hypothetical protein